MAAVIEASCKLKGSPVGTGEAYDTYRDFCAKAGLRPLSARAFTDLLTELDMYSLLRCRVISRGRRGRTTEITHDLPDELVEKIREVILMHFELRG